MVYRWVIADNMVEEALQEGVITEVEAGGRKLCVLKKEGKIYAFAATCPHAGGRLCEGWLDPQQRIVCPEHKYRFDPANGRNTSGEGYKLRTFPAEVRNGFLYIGLMAPEQ